MATEIKVPELPESVSEATVGEWQKEKGEAVKRDENIVDLETDKVVLEVPAIADGVLTEIKVEAGDTVQAGDVLALLDEGASADEDKSSDTAAAAEGDQAQDKAQQEAAEDTAEAEQEAPAASPAARKLMEENNLAASAVKGTGKDNRITKADVLAHLEQRETQTSS